MEILRSVLVASASLLLVACGSTPAAEDAAVAPIDAFSAEDAPSASDDAFSAEDAPTITEDAPTAMDAPMVAGGDYYELDAMRQDDPFTKACMAGGGRYLISGRVGGAAGGTAFNFTFQAAPAPGAYTIEPRIAGPTSVPSTATSVWVDYGSQVRGGSDELHVGQSGTVTVTMEGAQLRAATSGIASIERTSSATGTIGAQITCP